MNTQDPYRDLSSMKKRDEYPGYDDFVPYRSDWRYGVGFFSLLMIGIIAYGYWKLEPEPKIAVVASPANAVAKVVTPTPVDSVTKTIVAEKPTATVAPVKKEARASRMHAPVKDEKRPTPLPAKQAEPMKTVTGPPIH